MKDNHERDARWFAYLLGELPDSERDAVEAEMAAAPEEAERARRVCETVGHWASESIVGPATDLPALLAKGQIAPGAPRPAWWTKAWPWAVAATFLLAVSQLSFSVQVGGTTIAWGQPSPVVTTSVPEDLVKRLDAIETASQATRNEVSTMAAQALTFEDEMRDTTAELAYNQQLEADARFRDIERLIALTGMGRVPSDYLNAMFTENP